MQHFSRPLNHNDVVEDFLQITLQLDYKKDKKKLRGIVAKIVDGELGVSKFNVGAQTLSVLSMRSSEYRKENDRWNLRKQVIQELWTQKRLEKDDKIKLGKGGALPIASDVKNGKQAFILIGLPASGKSAIANEIAEDYGAVVIDSDYAKRKLPEFSDHLYGASIVHEESQQITFGFESANTDLKSLYKVCVDSGANIVIPRIGQNPVSIINLAQTLKEVNGYKVHLVLISLPKRDATIRAVYRFAASERYVPLGLIFDGYGNDPSHCYYYLRTKYSELFESMGAVSTSSRSLKQVDVKENSPVLKYPHDNVILQLP